MPSELLAIFNILTSVYFVAGELLQKIWTGGPSENVTILWTSFVIQWIGVENIVCTFSYLYSCYILCFACYILYFVLCVLYFVFCPWVLLVRQLRRCFCEVQSEAASSPSLKLHSADQTLVMQSLLNLLWFGWTQIFSCIFLRQFSISFWRFWFIIFFINVFSSLHDLDKTWGPVFFTFC